MLFLLDTNICIYIIKRKPQQVFDRFQTLCLSDVGVSSITVAELEYGAYKSQRVEQNRAALNQFLLPLEIVPFDESATQIYGDLRATLERQGTTIGGMDILIASQAIALSLTLVTNNTKEFSRILNLDLDNWVG
ncbi:MAG: VapC toxin family PIN domain ribonuclease [Leptolyngbya sp.]|nr:MAG: VapC toxin family PIN domain ribonuclease [Leptolyngbya sp.]